MPDDAPTPAEVLRLLPESSREEFLTAHAAFLNLWHLRAVAYAQPGGALVREQESLQDYGMRTLHRRMQLVRSTQAEQSGLLREILRRLPPDCPGERQP